MHTSKFRVGSVVFAVISATFLLASQATASGVNCTYAASYQWVPSKGYAWIDEDDASHFVRQYLYWRTWDRLEWFTKYYDTTYEPEAIFYNYNKNGSFGYKPIGFWQSDLPSPYVDTQLFDSFPPASQPDELAITVGSANAQLIVPGRFYSTVTRMSSTSGPGIDSTRVKLQSQRGARVPTTCYSTFCSFGCNYYNHYNTVSFQSGFIGPTLDTHYPYKYLPTGREWWWMDPGTTNRPWQ